MLYFDARDIIKRNNLIPRRASKAVLKAIAENQTTRPVAAIEFLTESEFVALKAEYARVKAQLEAERRPLVPRNLPFYLMVKSRYPAFDWAHAEPVTGLNRYVVKMEQPLVQGLLPSLLTLLMRAFQPQTVSWSNRKLDALEHLPPRVAADIGALLEAENFALPGEAGMHQFANWIATGLREQELTVLTPICPDYEAQQIGPNLYRYTFASLGTQIGVVGKRYLQALPRIARTLESLGLSVRYVVAIGDFEAFAPENCARLGISEGEFIARLRKSQEVFAANAACAVETPLFTDLCGGRPTWDVYYRKTYDALMNGNYGQSHLTLKRIQEIAAARAPLYRRWTLAKDIDPVQKLLAQGAEYAAMGMIAHQFLKNPLIIGADHWKMAPFFSCNAPVPVLYLKPNYADIGG